MSDARLRDLERVALTGNAREDWIRYYDERRRLGLGLPSGEAVWDVELPGPVTNLLVRVDERFGSDKAPTHDSEIIREVEQEWTRCGRGFALEVRGADGSAMVSFPWRDALPIPGFQQGEIVVEPRAGRDVQGPGEVPCGTCDGRGQNPREPEHLLHECLTCGGSGVVHPRVPLDLGARAEIRGPESKGSLAALAKALVFLSLAPGGVRVFGLHVEAVDRWPGDGRLPRPDEKCEPRLELVVEREAPDVQRR